MNTATPGSNTSFLPSGGTNNINSSSSTSAHNPSSRIHHFKLVLLGDTAVGKSCLVVRFVRDEFFEFQEPTIGGNVIPKKIEREREREDMILETVVLVCFFFVCCLLLLHRAVVFVFVSCVVLNLHHSISVRTSRDSSTPMTWLSKQYYR
jgi:hypothetical protein